MVGHVSNGTPGQHDAIVVGHISNGTPGQHDAIVVGHVSNGTPGLHDAIVVGHVSNGTHGVHCNERNELSLRTVVRSTLEVRLLFERKLVTPLVCRK